MLQIPYQERLGHCMENQLKFRCSEVIFRQGDAGNCMYNIQSGKVGIFLDYGGPNETRLAELAKDQFFGEMGLLEAAPRSATAVSLEDDTQLEIISEEDFHTYFDKNPDKVLLLMLQMCARLRHTTANYVDVCQTVRDSVEAETYGYQRSDALMERISKYTSLGSGTAPGNN